jgi:cellulose synthase/poly-beta-1,6-N-acetylglucosamine synthase-like glycosyltransferase
VSPSQLVVLMVPAHNEVATVADCLTAADAAELPAGSAWREWIVVDDASSDGTDRAVLQWSNQHPRPLRLERMATRSGKAAALNRVHRLMLEADRLADVVVVVDADARLEVGALKHLVGPFLRDHQLAVVWGVAHPSRVRRGSRASAFQMKLSVELVLRCPRTAVLALGRFFAYRVGALSAFEWDPTQVEDVDLARWLTDRRLEVRSVPEAVVSTSPARGWRDFYLQTYRLHTHKYRGRANSIPAASTGSTPPISRLAKVVAVAKVAVTDPIGAVAYLMARAVAPAIHRVAPGTFGGAWEVATSTKA